MQRRFAKVNKNKSHRLTHVSAYCKQRMCIDPNCQGPQPIYTRMGPYITASFPGTTTYASEEEEAFATNLKFDAEHARDILKNISDEDCVFMGLDPKQTVRSI